MLHSSVERTMNGTWTNEIKKIICSRTESPFMNEKPNSCVRERCSRNSFLSFVVHEHVRSCSVHVSFVREWFLLFSFLPFILTRTNEINRHWSFIVRPRSCLDERMFVRLSCGMLAWLLAPLREKKHSLLQAYQTDNCTINCWPKLLNN